jgi:hypothetical protein
MAPLHPAASGNLRQSLRTFIHLGKARKQAYGQPIPFTRDKARVNCLSQPSASASDSLTIVINEYAADLKRSLFIHRTAQSRRPLFIHSFSRSSSSTRNNQSCRHRLTQNENPSINRSTHTESGYALLVPAGAMRRLDNGMVLISTVWVVSRYVNVAS